MLGLFPRSQGRARSRQGSLLWLCRGPSKARPVTGCENASACDLLVQVREVQRGRRVFVQESVDVPRRALHRLVRPVGEFLYRGDNRPTRRSGWRTGRRQSWGSMKALRAMGGVRRRIVETGCRTFCTRPGCVKPYSTGVGMRLALVLREDQPCSGAISSQITNALFDAVPPTRRSHCTCR